MKKFLGTAYIRHQTLIGQDHSFFKWDEDEEVEERVLFKIYDVDLLEGQKLVKCIAKRYGMLGSSEDYGSGPIYTHPENLDWVEKVEEKVEEKAEEIPKKQIKNKKTIIKNQNETKKGIIKTSVVTTTTAYYTKKEIEDIIIEYSGLMKKDDFLLTPIWIKSKNGEDDIHIQGLNIVLKKLTMNDEEIPSKKSVTRITMDQSDYNWISDRKYIDSSGNVYFSKPARKRFRKITEQPNISVFIIHDQMLEIFKNITPKKPGRRKKEQTNG